MSALTPSNHGGSFDTAVMWRQPELPNILILTDSQTNQADHNDHPARSADQNAEKIE